MRSELQIQASRANGARSRGPVTAEGKTRSSKNALRHGMLAESIVLKKEASALFIELLADLQEEFDPQTRTESDLIETMAVCRWRLMRIWQIETAALDLEIDKQEDASPEIQVALAF